MKLVFIYGPPASGKLTVAKELSKISGIPVFHNHLTRDLVQSIYTDNLFENYDLVDTLRSDVFRYCAQRGTDIIFTFVYDGPEDNNTVEEKVNTVEENGGQVIFIELYAPHEELLRRVTDDTRKEHKKLTDRKTLSKLLKITSYSSVPYENVLRIDTSVINPHETAILISTHLNL